MRSALRYALFAALLFAMLPSSHASDFNSGRVPFTIDVKGVKSDLSILSVTAMPGEPLVIQTTAKASASKGNLERTQDGWAWHAPKKPGLSTIEFTSGNARSVLNVFVLTPWTNGQSKSLNGYKIGAYNTSPFRGLAAYKAPTGFIEMNSSLRKVKVSPHFSLWQFECKQQPGYDPAYLLIEPATLLKLERLLEAANKKGWRVDTLTVMSGFRTPAYNALIGNKTTSSRHIYGGAADVYIDADENGWMDDLNGDGVIDKKDAEALADLAETLAKSDPSAWTAGGLAVYPENSVHGPFVHIDVRGYRARWGR